MPFGIDGVPGELLSGLLNFNSGDGNLGSGPPRVPFSFSSKLRTLLGQATDAPTVKPYTPLDLTRNTVVGASTASEAELIFERAQLAAQAAYNRQVALLAEYEGKSSTKIAKSPFAQYLSVGTALLPSIETLINPDSVKITQGKRITSQDTQRSKVYWHWTDPAGQDNDVALVSLRGHTGNVDLRAGNLEASSGAYRKLLIYHNLWLLTREPVRLADGSLNEWSITLSGPLMPIDLTLYGFYSKVMDLDWQASSPFGAPYELAFTVTRTSPSLDEILSVLHIANLTPPPSRLPGG